MSEEFHTELRRVRDNSRYPRRLDFTSRAQVNDRNYRKYEDGEILPALETLEKILINCHIEELEAEKLRHLLDVARAKKMGLNVVPLVLKTNVSALAKKIQLEYEYELRRMGIQITPRTRKVCTRRLEIILKNEIGES